MVPRPLLDMRWTSQSINNQYNISPWNLHSVLGESIYTGTYLLTMNNVKFHYSDTFQTLLH